MNTDNGGADSGTDAFNDFVNSGEVEVGSTKDAIESNVEPEEPKAKKGGGSGRPPREKPAAPAAKAADETAKGAGKPGADAAAGDDGDDDGDEGDDGEDEDEDEDGEKGDKKPKKRPPSERIRELNARFRREERLRIAADERLTNLEKSLLREGTNAATNGATGNIPAPPDPSDGSKYPLGHLDDRYIEDKLEWLAERKAAERADAVLQRQQESERQAQSQTAQRALLEKVDDLSTRGSEQYDDFQEAVVDAGMRGDWRLEQPTFEAAFEAKHGARILYELSQDKKEAARVASLSPYQQMQFVLGRDAELSSKGGRTKPGAGAPPSTQTRGTNSRTRINPATDNLDDFEKAWAAEGRKG